MAVVTAEASVEERVAAALALHEPVRICVNHHITQQAVLHDCGGPYLYRCSTCARTRSTPCRTWQALTGKDLP